MVSSARVPVSANVEKCFVGTFNDDKVEVTLYTGYASDGYKSDFERRPARWLVWERFNSSGKRIRHIATRYGGKRFGKGLAEYVDAVRQLREAGVQPKEKV